MAQRHKRTRLWIDPPFQARLLLRMGLYLLLYSVLVWHIGFFIELLQCVASGSPSKVTGELYFGFLWKQKSMLVAMFAIAPIFLYDLVKFSHRVAGPLYRCRTLMRDMASGKAVPAITPRKHDLMQELLEALNRLIVVWNARVAAGNEPETSASQRSEVRGQRSEVGSQGSEVGV